MKSLIVLALIASGCTSQTSAPRDEAPVAVAPPAAPPPAADRSIVRGTLAVDGDHACAITATGHVACWGHGAAGRLGAADGSDHWTPVEVPGVDDAIGVAASDELTCAWTAHGAASCWGAELVPPRGVPGLADIVQIVVDGRGACGLRATGGVACWTGADAAHDVPGLAEAVEIAGYYGGGAALLCARLKGGDVTCGNAHDPFAVIPALAGATSLGGAGSRYAVLLPGHRMARWVGFTGSPMPEMLDGVDGERVVVGGHLSSPAEICVLGPHARCWGWSAEPMRLSEPRPLADGVRDVATDTEATCTRIADHVECAGRVGRLGDGDAEYTAAFVPVTGIADARQLEAAGRTFCALRANGHIACWGEPVLDEPPLDRTAAPVIRREPVEIPGVTDAVEIAMESGDRWEGAAVAIAVCARRAVGATCWTLQHGAITASDAPELASATKLYSGPAVCGASARDDVRCVRHATSVGAIDGFSEQDYDTYAYRGPAILLRELAKRLHKAIVAKRPPVGFHSADTRDSGEVIAPDPVLASIQTRPRAPVDPRTDAGEVRRIEWMANEPGMRVRTAVCARHTDGTIACWGEREFLGAGLRSERSDPAAVAAPARH